MIVLWTSKGLNNKDNPYQNCECCGRVRPGGESATFISDGHIWSQMQKYEESLLPLHTWWFCESCYIKYNW